MSIKKYYKNKDWLYQKYWIEGLTTYKIAEICGCNSEVTILNWMNKFNIKRRTQSEIKKGRKGKKARNWKGGQFKSTDGYIRIWKPNHPNSNKNGYIKRVNLIAEKILGRYLKKNEMAHHLNEIRDDDRNENLLICTRGYHVGLHNKMQRGKPKNVGKNNPFYGKKHTLETKEKISNSLMGEKNPMFGKKRLQRELS